MAICSDAFCYQAVFTKHKNWKEFSFKMIFSNTYRNSPTLKHGLVIHIHCQHVYKLIHIVTAVLCVYSLSSLQEEHQSTILKRLYPQSLFSH